MTSSERARARDCVLTNYPLSRSFEERLKALLTHDAVRLSVGQLRQQPVLQMLKYLRSLKVSRLILPVEDENGSALLPVLTLLASVVPADHIYLVDANLQLRRVARFEAVVAAFRLLQTSIAAIAARNRARREIAALLISERAAINAPKDGNVLYLNANLWFGVKVGGSVGHISGVVNALLQEDCEVDFVSAGGRLLVSDKANYTQLDAPKHFGFPWELNYFRFHFDAVEQVERLGGKERPGWIYQRMSIANYSGVSLSRLWNIPLVLEYNGSEVWVARNWGRRLREEVLAEQIEEANLRLAHMIVTISDVLRDELLARGVPPERIVSYPNCIDPEMFDPARFSGEEISELKRRHGVADDAIVVMFIGTFGQWHGAEVLAEAIRRLLDEERDWIEKKKVRFLLVGDGLKMPEVRKALGDHARGPYVILVGLAPQHEAPLYLAASDILVSPHVANADGSRFFGSPTKLFEYMAMGKAILASDLDQIGDVLAGGVQVDALAGGETAANSTAPAVLARSGDTGQIVDGLKFLVENKEQRLMLGANARRLALERYTWRHHTRAILDGAERLGLITVAARQ